MSGRSYLSIGDVLTLLRQEFPDVTISKIRFLESQGLVNPERTPSGYRKFYEHDVERLRWVLRQQREHFLPLKVIKDRLDEGTNGNSGGRPAPARAAAPTPPRPAAEPALVGSAPASASVGTTESEPVRSAAANVSPPVSAGSGRPPTAVDRPTGPGPAPSATPSVAPAPVTPAPVATAGQLLPPDPDPSPPAAPRSESTGDPSATPPTTSPAPAAPPAAPPSASPPPASPAPAPPTSAAPPPATPVPAAPPTPPPAARAAAHERPATPRPPTPAAPAATPAPPEPSRPIPPPVRAATPPTPRAAPTPAAPAADSHITLEELATACGLDAEVLGQLREYGLLTVVTVGGVEYYDDEAVAIATLAAGFARHGVEPRHLRLYKNAADREAGFVEQIVLPLVRQRNPDARARAVATSDELIELGQGLRRALLRNALRELFGN